MTRNWTRPPYGSTMGTFPYHSVSQLFLLVLICMKFHALSVKSNLGKIWSNLNLNIFRRKWSKSQYFN